MNNKYVRWLSIILGIFLFLLILGNFGLNYWLKNNLPTYLKKNTAYNITYKGLNVELLSGNISARGISINNKIPVDKHKIGLQGTVDSLSISRFGIYDALVNNNISTKNIILIKPVLNIKLTANKIRNKKNKNPVDFRNVNIKDGTIQIFKSNDSKLLSVSNLNLRISDLELNSGNNDYGLPLGFDSYSINATDLYFRPDNSYLITANTLNTTKGQLKLSNLGITPLLSFNNFVKYNPQKNSMLSLKAKELLIDDFKIKNKKITVRNILLDQAFLKLYTAGNKKNEQRKKAEDFQYDISLDNLLLKQANLEVLKLNQSPLLAVQDLTFNLKELELNKETINEKVPFAYKSFLINSKNIDLYTSNEHLKIAIAKVNQSTVSLNNILLKTTKSDATKNNFDLRSKSVFVKINDWKTIDQKFKFDIDQVFVDQIQGKIASATQKAGKDNGASIIKFPLSINRINIKNSDLNIENKGNPMQLTKLNININNLEVSESSLHQKLLKSESYTISLASFTQQPNKFYRLSANNLKLSNNSGQISNFEMKPLVSRAQFIRMIPTEKDLYDIKLQNLSFKGQWDLLNSNQFVDVDQANITGLKADIFRSKIPDDDLTVKPLYSKLLRSIKIPLFVNNVDIKNSTLVYEEDTPTSDGPGRINFNPFNLNIKNINSGKMKGKPTQVAITIDAGFMDASPLHINWGFNTMDMRDRFKITGSVSAMAANNINPFIEPYLNVTATGLIKKLDFNFNGDPSQISGVMKMQHDNLKVQIKKKKTGEVNEILSWVANLVIKNTSDKYPESVSVNRVERDNTKSFFNLLWKGMQDGLAQTLIGINYKKSIDQVKNTVETVKDGVANVKDEVKEVQNSVKKSGDDVKKSVDDANKEVDSTKEQGSPPTDEQPKKKGFFKKIFKKNKE